ncbi:MAG: hypothetical protein WCQ95_01500 [Bacteroidota bacterium]
MKPILNSELIEIKLDENVIGEKIMFPLQTNFKGKKVYNIEMFGKELLSASPSGRKLIHLDYTAGYLTCVSDDGIERIKEMPLKALNWKKNGGFSRPLNKIVIDHERTYFYFPSATLDGVDAKSSFMMQVHFSD